MQPRVLHHRVIKRGIIGQTFSKTLSVVLLVATASYGQSLGDAARANRDQQDAENTAAAKPRVITNKDLPRDPDAGQAPSQPPPAPGAAADAKDADRAATDHRSTELGMAEQRFAKQRLAQQRTADLWKRQILAQKLKMANLQARIDQLHASIQSETGGVQSEGPFNRYQARQLQQAAQLQLQLDEQGRRLDQMQDAARHAGLHSAVYDP
jgi:hypothetical protein